MIKKNVKKLHLNRETVKQLDLSTVWGGDVTKTMTVDTKCRTCSDGTDSAAGCLVEVV